MRAPPGFAVHRDGGRLLVVASELEAAVRELSLLDPGVLSPGLAPGDGGPPGRGPTAVVSLPGRSERLLLRSVRHGGWLAPLTGERLRSPGRPLAELLANALLRTAGAPVPQPALVVARRRRGAGWSAVVGTVYEEAHRNAAELLAADPPHARQRALAEAAGRALRRFHDAGGRHADLHVANLIVGGAADRPRVCVVDLDRARVVGRVSPRRRMREIMRLHRSLEKRGLAAAHDRAVHARFLAGYAGADADLRRALRAALPRERLRSSIHRLAWRAAGRV